MFETILFESRIIESVLLYISEVEHYMLEKC